MLKTKSKIIVIINIPVPTSFCILPRNSNVHENNCYSEYPRGSQIPTNN